MSGFPRLDVLPAAQRTLWPQLADVSRHSFVLYGGTAVALYLGHRESVDFDFFTNLPFQPDDLIGSYRRQVIQRLVLEPGQWRSGGTALQRGKESAVRSHRLACFQSAE